LGQFQAMQWRGNSQLRTIALPNVDETDADDDKAIGKLLDILPAGDEAVVVVEVGEGAKESVGGAAAVADHDALLAFVAVMSLDDGTGDLVGLFEDVLVDLFGESRCVREEAAVSNLVDVQLIAKGFNVGGAIVGFVDNVQPKVLLLVHRNESR